MAKAALNMMTRTSAQVPQYHHCAHAVSRICVVSAPASRFADTGLRQVKDLHVKCGKSVASGAAVVGDRTLCCETQGGGAQDTGWINDENPLEKALEIFDTNFQTPIDEEDAMARVLDPVLDG